MHALRLSPVVFVVLCAACPNEITEVCGLSTELPTVAEGRGEATRSDGEEFLAEPASWLPGSSGSLTIGPLDIIIANEETGLETEQLIADGAFPICVPLRDRSTTSGQANLVTDGFVSDADHTGGVAILDEADGAIIGRFEVDMADASGADAITFSDGVFHATRR